MDFLIADIGKEDVILGYPWLAAYEPQFDWKKGTMRGEFHLIVFSSTSPLTTELTIRALRLEEREEIL